MNLDEAKKTIRDLLNLANDNAAAELEAENALRFARRLMLRHNVSEEEIMKAQGPHERAADVEAMEYRQADVQTLNRNIHQWERTLAHAMTSLVGSVKFYIDRNKYPRMTEHGTRAFDHHGVPAWSGRFVFYGPAEDVQAATELFHEWSEIVVAMCRLRYAYVFKGEGRAYCEGFCSAVHSKVAKVHHEEQKQLEAGTLALVLVGAKDLMKRKRDYCDTWLHKTTGIRLVSGGGRGRVNNYDNAWHQGHQDGARANLQRRSTKKLS